MSGVRIIEGFVKFPLILHSLHDLFLVLEQTKSNEVIYCKVREIYGRENFRGHFRQNRGQGKVQ